MTDLVNFIADRIDKNEYEYFDDLDYLSPYIYDEIRDFINEYHVNIKPLNETSMKGEKLNRTTIDKILKNILKPLSDEIQRRQNIDKDNQIMKTLTKLIKSKKVVKLTQTKLYKLVPEFVKQLRFKTMTKEELKEYENEFIGSKTLKEWFKLYDRMWDEVHNPSKIKRRQKKERRDRIKDEQRISVDKENETLPYPFKSKVKKYMKENSDVIYEEIPTDPQTKQKELKRPYFSPYPHAWEIDHVDHLLKQNDKYLFCVNVNTRFLIAYKIPEKSEAVRKALTDLIERFKVKSIRGDGAPCFTSNIEWLNDQNINTFFTSSKFTFHNKICDSVIKTIRNAIGFRSLNDNQLNQIINYYNNTYHKAIKCTPSEMMENEDIEWKYIRQKHRELMNALDKQKELGLLSYKKGCVLLIHLNLAKTADRDEKRRKRFDRLGIFEKYENGNVKVKLLRPVLIAGKYVNVVTVPIYFTRFISDDLETLPVKYKNNFIYQDLTS